MVERVILTVIAYGIMISVSGWIAVQCWKDSRNDFRMLWRDVKCAMKKKKKADRGGKDANDRQTKIIYLNYKQIGEIRQGGRYEKD